MHQTLPQMVFDRIERFADRTALRRKINGTYQDISWQQFGRQIRAFAGSLLSLGLKPEQQAAIMAPNCPEWAFADLAILSVGARTVPIYHTEGLKTIAHILADAECRILFTHSALLATELLKQRDKLPQLKTIILLEGSAEAEEVLSLESFLELAEQTPATQLETLLQSGQRKDLATLVYTSGTTGEPKGAMLSHDNILSNVEACSQLIKIGPEDQCLSFLPLSHIFERMAGYYLMLYQGVVIAYAESIDTVPANLIEVKPTIVISVPRLYEKMYNRVLERVTTGPWLKKQLFFWAIKVGKQKVAREQQGQTPTPLQTTLLDIFEKLVFCKIKDRLGGRLRFFISGGAPLVKEIAEFFLAAGVPIYEGYGLTETSPVIAVNYPGKHRLGTVGLPLQSQEVKIAEDGELLVKGPNVFLGYWKNPERSAEALKDGWFCTGDIGALDNDGFLTITDRKKDIIVTAGGKNIAPQELENLLKTDKFISSVMIYGDQRPYLTALVVPDFEALQKYAAYKKIDFLDHCDLVNHPQILNLIRRRIDKLQRPFPSFRQIKRFTLLSRDFSGEKGEVTPTLKIKRNIVGKRFAKVLEDLYRQAGEAIHDTSYCTTGSEAEKTGVEKP
ncbi:MAG: long-chain fatty acid--CoA ligase [Deltaproteobacteria bacterium]|nr:long-chain fatty acid--CoA ligase [Deltaproteobacteria bacterium]